MKLVKIINEKTKVIKELNKLIANDYIGTGEWKLLKEDKVIPQSKVTNVKNNG